jgi:hypothetical protein
MAIPLHNYFTSHFGAFTFHSSSPGCVTGILSMKAQWAKREPFKNRRKLQPIDPFE